MKITHTYFMPRDKDEELLARKGASCFFIILDLDEWLRRQGKDGKTPDIYEVRDKLHELMEDRGVRIDMVP